MAAHSFSISIMSAVSAKVMKQSGGQMLKMLLAMPKINRDLQRLRDHSYPIKNILDIIQNDDQTDTIVYTSPEFQPCADTFSDRYAFVGPSIRPATENIEKTHDVLIYISMGTVNNDLLPFYHPDGHVRDLYARVNRGVIAESLYHGVFFCLPLFGKKVAELCCTNVCKTDKNSEKHLSNFSKYSIHLKHSKHPFVQKIALYCTKMTANLQNENGPL